MRQPRFWWKSPSRRPRVAHCPLGRSRRACFEPLEARLVLSAPSLADIDNVDLLSGSPLHIPLDGFDADGDALTFTAESNDPNVTMFIPEGNRSMRISVLSDDGLIDGDMILELFEGRAPRATSRIIELAESGFYDGVIFHRVIDGFMIQAGDPTSTGESGSDLPDFDDQFHVDLQHNTTGVLSMAKSTDDTNDSQFFIVDTPDWTELGADYPRHLDFNHSVFGQLIEGFDVLEAISARGTAADSSPDPAIVMTSVEIFVDHENAVLMLKAPEGYASATDVTITVRVNDGNGGEDEVTFTVTVTPDGIDADPYLDDLDDESKAKTRTTVDTATTFQLTAIDVEEDSALFLNDWYLSHLEVYDEESETYVPIPQPIPIWSHDDLDYEVGLYTGVTTVTPKNGLTGIHPITVATGVYTDAIDYQVVPIYIVPDEAPTAQLDLTLVRDLTEVDAYGEVDVLPESQWIDEWDSFAIEIWATITEPAEAGEFGVHTVSTDLTFDNDLFTATGIEYRNHFVENRTYQIDNTGGVITALGGTTDVFTIDGYPDEPQYDSELEEWYYSGYPADPVGVSLYGDGQPVLVARVYFEPNLEGTRVPHNATDGYLTPHTELGFALADAQVLWSSADATALTTGTLTDAQLWPVMYDLDDDDSVDLGDLSFFAAAYGHAVGETGVGYTWASDFDHDGTVDLGDLSYFAAVYTRDATTPGRLNYPFDFPSAWQPTGEGAAPMSGSGGGSGGGDSSSEESSSGVASDWQRDAAIGQASLAARRSRSEAREETATIDLLMQFYDPEA